jgi:hypothetical protein
VKEADDETIRNEISILNAFIDQHVIAFYSSETDSTGVPIRRRIAETLIDEIIQGSENGTVSLPPSLNSRLKCNPQRGKLQTTYPETLSSIPRIHQTETVTTILWIYASSPLR